MSSEVNSTINPKPAGTRKRRGPLGIKHRKRENTTSWKKFSPELTRGLTAGVKASRVNYSRQSARPVYFYKTVVNDDAVLVTEPVASAPTCIALYFYGSFRAGG